MIKKGMTILVICILLLISSMTIVQSISVTEKTSSINQNNFASDDEFAWQRTGSGIVKHVEEVDDGYILSGGIIDREWYLDKDFSDAFIMKLDEQGNKIWETIVDINKAEYFKCVRKDTDGGYIATGYTYNKDTDDENLLLAKFNGDGDLVWSQTFGGDKNEDGYGVFVDQDSYMVFGNTKSYSLGKEDIWILKVSKTGSQIWNKTTSRNNYQSGVDVRKLSNGGYILTGEKTEISSDNPYKNRRAWLAKIDAEGEISWDKYYFSNYSYGMSVVEDSSGNYAFVGYFRENRTDGIESRGLCFFIKTDENGNLISQKNYTELTRISSIDATNDGGFILFSTDSNNIVTGQDWLLAKVDTNGNMLWNRYFEGLKDLSCSNDFSDDCWVTDDGGYIMIGQTGSISVDELSYLVVKTDSSGHLSQAPINPEIYGPSKGKAGMPYNFSFDAIDPDGNDIYYRVDFGLNNYKNDKWVGPFRSGPYITISNEWPRKGTYTIKLTLYDSTLEYSNTITKEIEIEGNGKSKNIQFTSFFEMFLQRFPKLKNIFY